MTLTFSGVLDRDVFLHAADLVGRLVARPEVAAAWGQESSCAGMTVGGLARHLVEQSLYVVEYLPVAAPADAPRISMLQHYAYSGWAHEGPDGPENQGICAGWNQQATVEGPSDTERLQSKAIEQLPGVLGQAAESMYLPWQEVLMPTDDFVVTRMMEMVVHSDDLATSLDLPTPEFGPAVLEPVVGLLAALSAVRHGQDAVIRTLTRPQRAPDSIAAF
jgi:hypothetical protein